MFEYKCVVDNKYDMRELFWINSDLQLKENDMFIVNDKKYYIDSFEEGYIIVKPVGSIIAVWKS